MTYEKGQLILATDINGFIGSGGLAAYASQAAVDAASPCVGALWGIGYGDRGYGQTSPTFSLVNPGDIVGSAEWDGMTDALRTILTHQNGTLPTLMPPDGLFDVGDLVVAHENDPPSSNAYDLNSQIVSADSNRLIMSVLQATSSVIGGTSSDTRATSWGSGSTSIDHEMTVDFTTTEKARFFFNSGGEIRINLSHPSGSFQDSNWRTVLITTLETVKFKATETVTTGSGGLNSSIGYYNLTDSYQTIIDGTNIGSDAYTTNDLLIEAKRSSTDTTNGANGIGVTFRITLTDQHTNVFSDSVAAGTSVSYMVLKSSLLANPTIEIPSGTLNNGF